MGKDSGCCIYSDGSWKIGVEYIMTILGVGLALFFGYVVITILGQVAESGDFLNFGDGFMQVIIWPIIGIGVVLLIVALAQTDMFYAGTRPAEGAGRAETIIHVR